MKDVLAVLDESIFLSVQEIKKHLLPQTALIIADMKVYDSITSTIHYIEKQRVIPGKVSICLAEHQTHGKGRLGRTWYSPFAKNVYLSLAWLSQRSFTVLPKLGLVIGLAVIKVLEELGITDNLKIRWPNDVVWNGKKLAGIIGGQIPTPNNENHPAVCYMDNAPFLISIGLNVNMLPSTTIFPISQPWTSVQEILKCYQDRNKIVAMLLGAIAPILQELEATGTNKLLELWPQYDALYGSSIKLDIGKKDVCGIAEGVDEYGHLKVRNKQGELTAYAAGEVELCTCDETILRV